jgi:hypothetical protein
MLPVYAPRELVLFTYYCLLNASIAILDSTIKFLHVPMILTETTKILILTLHSHRSAPLSQLTVEASRHRVVRMRLRKPDRTIPMTFMAMRMTMKIPKDSTLLSAAAQLPRLPLSYPEALWSPPSTPSPPVPPLSYPPPSLP